MAIWISTPLFALASPHGWIALAMPVLMLHFLINVTGLKATEEQALRSKGERYRLYQARTSGFIPWFRQEDRTMNATIYTTPPLQLLDASCWNAIWVPDWLIRRGIRKLLAQRLREENMRQHGSAAEAPDGLHRAIEKRARSRVNTHRRERAALRGADGVLSQPCSGRT